MASNGGHSRWNYYRDLSQQEGFPGQGTGAGAGLPHEPEAGSADVNGYFLGTQLPQPRPTSRGGGDNTVPRSAGVPTPTPTSNTTTTTGVMASATAPNLAGSSTTATTATSSALSGYSSSAAFSGGSSSSTAPVLATPSPTPYGFLPQHGYPVHPDRRSMRSWVHELSNDDQPYSVDSRSGSTTSTTTAAAVNDDNGDNDDNEHNRRPSAASTNADNESVLSSPTSSRASPRPMGPQHNILPLFASHLANHPTSHFASSAFSAHNINSNMNYMNNTSIINNNNAAQLRLQHVQAPFGGMPQSFSSPLRPVFTQPSGGNATATTRPIPTGIHTVPQYVLPEYVPKTYPHNNNNNGNGISSSSSSNNVNGGSGTLASDPAAAAAAPTSAAKFLAIGIDFGTTYSGVSWAFSGRPTDIHDVEQYPCVSSAIKGRDEVQVPTQYDRRTGAWGYLVDKEHSPSKWFKLFLLRDGDIRADILHSPYLQAARQQVSQLGDDGVIDLVAEYLRALWQHTMEDVRGQKDARALQNARFKVALTIPAIWPYYARQLMKRAVDRAGILEQRDMGDTTLELVEEPEAAALATLLDRRDYVEMAVGDTFLVCDCGGGTIDIISYQVVQTTPFVIREVVRGDGKLCGAFLVDDKFEHHMRHLAGLKFDSCDPADFRKFVNDSWEYAIKRSFSLNDLMPEYYLNPPIRAFSAFARLKGQTKIVLKKCVFPLSPPLLWCLPLLTILPRETVKGFFAETVQGILDLIRDQTRKIEDQEHKPPKKILLVGGLGNSPYVRERIQAEFPNVMQPRRAWSAVARGAVIKLLKNTSAQKDVWSAADDLQRQLLLSLPANDVRIARYSYGVEIGVPLARAFPPVELGAEGVDRISTEPDGQQRVWRMQWYLEQGQVIDNREPVSHKFYEYVTATSPRQTTFRIFTSDALPPPHRLDASCQLLCTITCEYDTPFHELRVVDEARGLRVVDGMRLTMRFNGEPEWRLQVGSKTTECMVNVQYE
ncbi:Heat shock protein Hsp70 [Niveomyces insectorum RCEF 264]|uniref:Heat shock protein Hsp70 n=1 Tax=Niveomyces insectorum RCEF 264 TaxID=1081102 RepID=A0A167MM24_9HYPO|nr:Heat shock protein Hsp70 [Niveomyces insectorum RCEF 264]